MNYLVIDVAFFLSFLLFPLIIIGSLTVSKIRLDQVEIVNFSIIALFVFSYIGLVSLYFGFDDFRYQLGISDKSLILRLFMFSVIAISCIALLYGFLSNIIKLRILPAGKYSVRGLVPKEAVILSSLLFICVAVLVSYISQLDSIAIIAAVIDGIGEAKVSRSNMANNFSGNYHWYSLFMHDVAQIISFALFANHLVGKTKLSKFLFVISFVFCASSLIMSTQKAPVIWYFIGLYFVYLIVLRGGKIPIKGSLKLLIILMAFLIGFYIIFMGMDSPLKALMAVFSRTFGGSLGSAYFYLEFFPEQHDFLFGQSIKNPGGILPYEPFAITKEIMAWRFPGLHSQNIVGSSPAVFWGEAYANFSWIGVVVTPLIIGSIIYLVSYLISIVEHSPIQVGSLVWTLLHYRTIASTGFSSFIIDIPVICLFFIFSLTLLLSGTLRPQNA
jgi:hypothetical protein